MKYAGKAQFVVFPKNIIKVGYIDEDNIYKNIQHQEWTVIKNNYDSYDGLWHQMFN